MKRQIFLILIVGIITLGSLLLETQPAFAYCVYNDASDTIRGYDIGASNVNARWEKKLNPGTYDCCPGTKDACKNASVRVQWDDQVKKSNKVCQVNIPATAALVVTDNEGQLVCTIN